MGVPINNAAGQAIGDASITQVHGQKALGGFRLLVNVMITNPGYGVQDGAELRDAFGDLMIGSERLCHLHRLGPIQAPRLPPFGSGLGVLLYADVSAVQMEALERARDRNGGDLPVNVQFTHTVESPPPHGVKSEMGQLSYVVPQSEWVKVLTAMEYQKTLLLEIPLPDAKVAKNLASVVQQVEAAQADRMGGKFGDAVGDLRKALEALGVAIHDDAGFDEDLRKVLGVSRQWPKAKRVQLLRQALINVLHLAPHGDPVAVETLWDRTDATALLAMTVAMVQELDAVQAKVDTVSPTGPPEPQASGPEV